RFGEGAYLAAVPRLASGAERADLQLWARKLSDADEQVRVMLHVLLALLPEQILVSLAAISVEQLRDGVIAMPHEDVLGEPPGGLSEGELELWRQQQVELIAASVQSPEAVSMSWPMALMVWLELLRGEVVSSRELG